MSANTDPTLDEHLKTALAHAPDAQLQPPPVLSQRILQEARVAVSSHAGLKSAGRLRTSSPPVGLTWWGELWQSLGRGPAAGAMAGLMVATLLSAMWWGNDPEDTAAQYESAMAPKPPAPAAPAPAPAAVPVAVPEAVPAAVARAPAMRAEGERKSARQTAERSRELAREISPMRMMAAETAASSPADTVAERRELSESRPARSASSKVAHPPVSGVNLGGLLDSLSHEPLGWSWRPDASAARPLTQEFVSWLSSVHQSTAGKWVLAGEVPQQAPRLTWTVLSGHQVHEFRLSATQLRWTPPDGRVWVADLDEPTVTTWLRTWTTLQRP